MSLSSPQTAPVISKFDQPIRPADDVRLHVPNREFQVAARVLPSNGLDWLAHFSF